MNGLSHAELFFIISSAGFVALWILIAILIVYLIRVVKIAEEILAKVRKDIDTIGDITKETLEDIRHSAIFSFLFRRKRRNRREESSL